MTQTGIAFALGFELYSVVPHVSNLLCSTLDYKYVNFLLSKHRGATNMYQGKGRGVLRARGKSGSVKAA